MKDLPPQKQVSDEVAAGAAIYSRPLLAVYDLVVLGFSNRSVWQCPSPLIRDFYKQHVSAKHLDVGVGTGYFLDKCMFPVPNPTIVVEVKCRPTRRAADLVVRAAKNRRFGEELFSVSLVGSPTKPLTLGVRRAEISQCLTRRKLENES